MLREENKTSQDMLNSHKSTNIQSECLIETLILRVTVNKNVISTYQNLSLRAGNQKQVKF